MSRAYKFRLKAIRDEKRRLGVKKIAPVAFYNMQAQWRAALDGPLLGTLEDVLKFR